jgi:TIR domain
VAGPIFVSYSRRDVIYAQTLIAHLRQAGLIVWFDSEIPTGQRWDRTVRAHIDRCGALLLLMSPSAEDSDWVAAEIDHARKRSRPIIPLLLAGEVFFGFSRTQYVDVTDGSMPDEALVSVLAAHADSDDTPIGIVPAVPDPIAIVSSQQFRMARRDLRRQYAVFTDLIADSQASDNPPKNALAKIDIEVDLIDGAGQPAMVNAQLLAMVDDPDIGSEIGQFTIEVAQPPAPMSEHYFDQAQRILSARLRAAHAAAGRINTRLIMIGILPTLTLEHTTVAHMSADDQYAALDEIFSGERRGDVRIDIQGVERLQLRATTIMAEAAATSAQYSFETTAHRFADHWNAAQIVAAVQSAVGANSPYLFGHCLWPETRTVLFEQALDGRPPDSSVLDLRPRAWFGERWLTSIHDLLDENLRYYPPTPSISSRHPDNHSGAADAGLPDLWLHNALIYRWNRLDFQIEPDRRSPRLFIQNRVLPAGPTVIDTIANIAFFHGLVHGLSDQETSPWSRLPFTTASQNFYQASHAGLGAHLVWPGSGQISVTDLVLSTLLPLAHRGLDTAGVSPNSRDRLLSIIERRCATGRNGATWQRCVVHELQNRGHDRWTALGMMTNLYADLSLSDIPVHQWPDL